VDGIDAVQAIIPGGTTRSRSVACGLRAVPETADAVLVHDAARPLVTPELVSRLLDALGGVDGAIAAAPLVDTVKRQGDDGLIARTVDRAALWLAQTPQVFLRAVIEGAFGGATDADLDAATDCSWLVERSGGRVALVDPGSPNIKVTTPADLVVVEALLRARLPGP
jgi:2-C-methyl-D-erythritol 4-phosphate cytidylyltransferase